MSQKIECNVCFNNVNDEKYMMCQICKGTTCTACQLEYGKPFCANGTCNYQYTQYQLIITYSKAVLDNSNIGKYWHEIYLEREKKLLPVAQIYIDHLEQYEKYRRNLRFGSFNKIPSVEKKTFEDFCTTTCDLILQLCPSKNCNSYIVGSIMHCNKCNISFCSKCNEPDTSKSPNSTGHVCDESTIKTINEIKNNSKPCPNCYVRIQKSDGCDDMRCTNCATFFSYNTLKIHKSNTNTIKDNEVFGSQSSQSSQSQDNCINVTISLPRFENCIDDESDIENFLTNDNHHYMKENVLLNRDPYSLLYIYNNYYQNYKICYNYMKLLFNDRVKVLKGLLKHDKWINNIYKYEYEYHRSIAISDILRDYLIMIPMHIIRGQITKELLDNIELYNMKFEEIYYTYGGQLIKINENNSIDSVTWIVDTKS